MKKKSFILWVLTHRNFKEIAGRIIDLIIGYLLIPISYITIRNKNKWLVGNKTGFTDNSKYLFLYLQNKYSKQIRCIWIASTYGEEQQLKALNLEVYPKWSLLGLYHSLTAGVYIFSSCVSDVNYWTSGKAIKINLWHGVGIKTLGLKGSDVYNPNSKLNRLLTPYNYDKPTFFIAPSDLMKQHFMDCYSLSEESILQYGYPRCDFILENKEQLDSFINRFESSEIKELVKSFNLYNKVLIYMPTFRDDQSDFIKLSGINFTELDSILKTKNYLLLLKMHPATRMDFSLLSSCTNIKLLEKKMDIYPILPYTDILITDYSSIYYDYILLEGKRIILFPFDYKEYQEKSRDFAFDYLQYTPGERVWNYEELRTAITSDNPPANPERQWVINTFWGDNYLNASEKIVKLLLTKIN